MEINPIKTEADYMAAMVEVEQLMEEQPEPGSAAFDKMDILATLIEKYEAVHFELNPPNDPILAIKFTMEHQNLKPADLAPMIGSQARVYEVLNGKRSLSLRMIRNLHRELRIPLSALVAEGGVAVQKPKRRGA